MENLFIQASRLRLRFGNGNLSVEDLWGLELVNSRNPKAITLDSLAIEVHNTLQQTATVSFVKEKTTQNKTDQLRLDILKFIIDTKQEEKAKATDAAEARSELEKLQAMKAQRDEAKLIELSDEDLDAKIAAAQAKL